MAHGSSAPRNWADVGVATARLARAGEIIDNLARAIIIVAERSTKIEFSLATGLRGSVQRDLCFMLPPSGWLTHPRLSLKQRFLDSFTFVCDTTSPVQL